MVDYIIKCLEQVYWLYAVGYMVSTFYSIVIPFRRVLLRLQLQWNEANEAKSSIICVVGTISDTDFLLYKNTIPIFSSKELIKVNSNVFWACCGLRPSKRSFKMQNEPDVSTLIHCNDCGNKYPKSNKPSNYFNCGIHPGNTYRESCTINHVLQQPNILFDVYI